MIGYENSFYVFKEFYFAGGESNPRPFRLLFHPLTPSQSRLTTRVVR